MHHSNSSCVLLFERLASTSVKPLQSTELNRADPHRGRKAVRSEQADIRQPGHDRLSSWNDMFEMAKWKVTHVSCTGICFSFIIIINDNDCRKNGARDTFVHSQLHKILKNKTPYVKFGLECTAEQSVTVFTFSRLFTFTPLTTDISTFCFLFCLKKKNSTYFVKKILKMF